MELRQIIYFIEVAKREHVTRAAETLHVAQSAISRQIALLESELGTPLFEREGRNVKLTHMGKVFLEHAERIVIEMDKAKERVEEFLNPEKGVIHLGFSSSLSVHTFTRVFTQFREEHPNLHFQLLQGTKKYLMQKIEKGDIDIAFIAPVVTDHPIVKGDTFFTEKLLLLLPENHYLCSEPIVRIGQLAGERFVTFRSDSSIRRTIDKACNQAGFEPIIAFEGEDMDTIKGLVSAGLGIGILPELAFSYNLPKDVRTVEIEDPAFIRSVGVITPKKRELAPSEKLLYGFLKSFYDRLYRFQL
ncbi:LysR family transcriptional regulator [Heyndrickxia oleronia]|uniref:LysR family transcriptional regulator n=1 Tax=Heyndrickxia oleronia TaxID=38875 RepID=A0AAW6T4W9_9BACI|nr:LysR family transcriptional regulator [Heyndrickxia oleronia]MCM3240848.1 LysR family transcriptional regulator [Heyndrickxia oleronia]MDH5164397.1 LysR family transcriptional regulator [Heyndrickxia oleronia]